MAIPSLKDLKNLRNRPFLCVNTISRPAKGVNTSVKGWSDNPNAWAIFEQPYVVDRVSNKVMREATVVIDVMGSAVVKNRFSEVPDSQVVEHYMNKYREQVAEAMNIWLTKVSKAAAVDLPFPAAKS